MKTDEAIELIREAAVRFASANISWEKTRVGIFGFWVGDDAIKKEGSPLQRAQHSEEIWKQQRKDMKNPYACIVKFMFVGGELIRWEQGVLDLQCPDGSKIGIPEKVLKEVPRDA